MAIVVHQAHHEAGLAGRTAILGPDHVRAALANEHDLIEFHHLLGHECSYAQVWTRDGLEKGIRSMVVVAMTAVLTPAGHSLRAHLRGAVINGVGRPELRQLMATVSFYLGAGIGTEVIATAAAELGGLKPGDAGYEFGDARITGSLEAVRERGVAMRRRMFGECPALDDRLAANDAEAAHEIIKTEYLFGVVWSHPDMPATTRALIVIGMLCASGRMESLAQYLRAARRLGCTREQINEVFLTAFVYCGESAAENGFRLAREAFASSQGKNE